MPSPAVDPNPTTFWEHLPRPIIGLAPMDGVSDAAFRLVVSRQGAPDVAFTEFTSVGDVCRGAEHSLSSFLYDECERPIVAQLYGKDPELFYQAAHVVCELGFDGLDINMGCPSHNVASSGSGAGLIRTPERAHEILRAARQGLVDWSAGQTLQQVGLKATRAALVRAMNLRRVGRPEGIRRVIPLSVKTRLGYDAVVVEQWVSHLLDIRPAVITIHGRTLTQMYRGNADWEAIRRAVEVVQSRDIARETLVLGNGDLHSLSEVVRRVQESGVDGVLVGRSTLGSPWFFRHKERARSASHTLAVPQDLDPDSSSVEERFAVMLAHARLFEELNGMERFPSMRKHLGWYCKGFPHAAALRARMVRACSSVEVNRIVNDYLSMNGGNDLSTRRPVEPDATAPVPKVGAQPAVV